MKTTIIVYNSVNSDYVREATDRLNMKIQEHSTRQESKEQEKANELTPTLMEIEHTENVEITTLQNVEYVEEVNTHSAVSEIQNQEDDEDELTDEEIDRMIRALTRKKKQKDFEM